MRIKMIWVVIVVSALGVFGLCVLSGSGVKMPEPVKVGVELENPTWLSAGQFPDEVKVNLPSWKLTLTDVDEFLCLEDNEPVFVLGTKKATVFYRFVGDHQIRYAKQAVELSWPSGLKTGRIQVVADGFLYYPKPNTVARKCRDEMVKILLGILMR